MSPRHHRIAARLSRKLAHMDQLAQRHARVEGEVKALVRDLSKEHGLIVPMRIEQARNYINTAERSAA